MYQVATAQQLRAIHRADPAPPKEASMKVQQYLVGFALSMLSVGASGQCAKPEMNPLWDVDKQQFRCVAPAGSEGISHDDTVSPKGDKEFCTSARDNLQKACPASDEGKACRGKAKSIFNACYKGQSGSQTGSPGAANQATRADRSTCMQTFIQQQQACQSRKLPPTAPGQPYVPDTCLQDALNAENACLAK